MRECGTGGDNHHLWRNRRTWWVAFSVVHDGHRQARVRRSLQTKDVVVARQRRDALMQAYAARPGVTLSVRLPAPRSGPPAVDQDRGPNVCRNPSSSGRGRGPSCRS